MPARHKQETRNGTSDLPPARLASMAKDDTARKVLQAALAAARETATANGVNFDDLWQLRLEPRRRSTHTDKCAYPDGPFADWCFDHQASVGSTS